MSLRTAGMDVRALEWRLSRAATADFWLLPPGSPNAQVLQLRNLRQQHNNGEYLLVSCDKDCPGFHQLRHGPGILHSPAVCKYVCKYVGMQATPAICRNARHTRNTRHSHGGMSCCSWAAPTTLHAWVAEGDSHRSRAAVPPGCSGVVRSLARPRNITIKWHAGGIPVGSLSSDHLVESCALAVALVSGGDRLTP